jgi:hypothetical protein
VFPKYAVAFRPLESSVHGAVLVFEGVKQRVGVREAEGVLIRARHELPPSLSRRARSPLRLFESLAIGPRSAILLCPKYQASW